MTENEPQNSIVTDALALGLTGPVKMSALKAIKTLIFGTADYGAAWFERWTAEVRAGTAARTRVSEALAKAASAQISEDEDLAARAVSAWLPRAVREQSNREAVAKEFLSELENSGEVLGSGDTVSSDWIERYAEFAGKVSEEDLRTVLARILVREVTQPGSVPISTLRIVSEMDAETARLFERMAARVFQGRWIHYSRDLTDEPHFEELLDLAAAGLISYPDTSTGEGFHVLKNETYMVVCRDQAVGLIAGNDTELSVKSIPLTRAGRQIYGALSVGISEKTARDFADDLIPSIVKADFYQLKDREWKYVTTLMETIVGDESEQPVE